MKLRRGNFRLRRGLLPLGVFLAVMLIHYLWSGFFPELDPAQAQWVSLPPAASSWWHNYLETKNYWLGYAYAVSLAFAAVALRRYLEDRACRTRNLALGGITFTGFLALAGCFLVGCCGSPMLLVYLNLFGASFLPLAKPLLAALATISILGAWWWLHRRQSLPNQAAPAGSSGKGEGCCGN